MLQEILTIGYDLTLIAAAVAGSIAFIRHIANATPASREKGTEIEPFCDDTAYFANWQEPDLLDCNELDDAVPAAPDDLISEISLSASPAIADVIIPFRRRPKAIDWQAMPPQQLRQQCQKRGIKWRNAHGKGKHLRKAEMVVALQRGDAKVA